ncbi:uncharacterized protein LOC135400909 [Ornithodoros turicata]|uniref:uncharacterized protein LOC135400909 n=1 Tax=Ornithodoros turicata TaxID=34597 RepID=UPI0031388FA2
MFLPESEDSAQYTNDTLRVSLGQIPPFSHLQRGLRGVHVRGVFEMFLDAIVRATKRRLLVVTRNERQWGYKLNGSFTGFMGLVHRNETDVFLGPVTPTIERMEAGHHSPPLIFTEVSVLTRRPGKFVHPFNFAKAFGLDVWLTMIFVAFVLALLLSLRTKYEGIARHLAILASNLWTCFCYMIGADVSDDRGLRRRIVWGSFSICMLVMMSLLSSRLVSTMLIKNVEDHIDSVRDIPRFSRVKVVVEKGTIFETFITKNRLETFRKLLRQIETSHGLFRIPPVQEKILNQVEKGTHVILCDLFFQQTVLSKRFAQRKGNCGYRRASEIVAQIPAGMYYRKGLDSGLKRSLDFIATGIIEQELFHRPMQSYTVNATKCLQEAEESVYAFKLEELQGSFIVWAIGIHLSLIVFVGELTMSKRHSRIS